MPGARIGTERHLRISKSRQQYISTARVDEIVCGLPRDFIPTAAAFLRDSAALVWIRQEDSGPLFGIQRDENSRITAEVIGSIGFKKKARNELG